MKKLQRVLALVGVALLLGLVVLTLVLGIMGSKYFLASLFAMIVVPVFIYGYMIVFRVFSARDRERMEESMKDEKNVKESMKDADQDEKNN